VETVVFRRVLGELLSNPAADEIRETEIHTAESRLVMTKKYTIIIIFTIMTLGQLVK
jgi:hypothetical protein